MIKPIFANVEKKINEYDAEGVRELRTETVKENIKIRIWLSNQSNVSDPRFIDKTYTAVTDEEIAENMFVTVNNKRYEVTQSAKIANGYQLSLKEVH
jgi:hypothetical protein